MVRQNVFQKNPEIGPLLLNQLITREITTEQAYQEFTKRGIMVTKRNIQKIMSTIREKAGVANNRKSIPRLKPVQPPPVEHVVENTQAMVTIIDRELEAIGNLDYKNVKEVEPVKILDKNMMKLELMLANTHNDDFVRMGSIIDLEMKVAREIHKMRPSSVEEDYNLIFKKFDLTTEFTILMNSKFPKLKQAWIDFIREKQLE